MKKKFTSPKVSVTPLKGEQLLAGSGQVTPSGASTEGVVNQNLWGSNGAKVSRLHQGDILLDI